MTTKVLHIVNPKDSLEVSFFSLNKSILRIIGFWPSDPLNRKEKFKIFINLIFLITAIIGELRFALLVRRDLVYAVEVICPCLTMMVTWIKLVFFVIYRRDLKMILEKLLNHCKADTENLEKNSLIVKKTNFANLWCKVLYMNAIFTLFMFVIRPLVFWTYKFLKNGTNDSWVDLPFTVALPYEDMSRINSKPLYSIIYCFLIHSGTVNILGVTGADGTFLCFCMYISVSYQNLQEDFKTTFNTYKPINSCSKDNDIIYYNLSNLVRRQQSLMEIFKNFNRIYKLVILVHFAFASITLGISLVNLRLISGLSKLIYLVYVIGAINQLFMYCYGCENVNVNCIKLSEVLYFCDWYKHNKKVKLLVLIVLFKSQKGSLIRAPFFSPSLRLFSGIIQTSGSYFSILQAVL